MNNIANACGACPWASIRMERYSPSEKINAVGFVAFLVVGCVGAAGLFSGATVGWGAVGLGLGLFAIHLARGNLRQRRVEVMTEALFTAAIVTIGILGGIGLLSAPQVGGGLIAVVLMPKLINKLHSLYSQQTKTSKSESVA